MRVGKLTSLDRLYRLELRERPYGFVILLVLCKVYRNHKLSQFNGKLTEKLLDIAARFWRFACNTGTFGGKKHHHHWHALEIRNSFVMCSFCVGVIACLDCNFQYIKSTFKRFNFHPNRICSIEQWHPHSIWMINYPQWVWQWK